MSHAVMTEIKDCVKPYLLQMLSFIQIKCFEELLCFPVIEFRTNQFLGLCVVC